MSDAVTATGALGQDSSPSVGKLFAALAKAQAELGPAIKDRENPHFRSTYATLSSALTAARAALAAHGLAVVQIASFDGQSAIVTTILSCGDEWVRGHLALRPTKPDPQGIGSAITYARRYAYMAILGLAPDDDDGQTASRPVERMSAPPPAAKPVAASATSAAGLDVELEVEAIWGELKEIGNIADLRALRRRMDALPVDVRQQFKAAYLKAEKELQP